MGLGINRVYSYSLERSFHVLLMLISPKANKTQQRISAQSIFVELYTEKFLHKGQSMLAHNKYLVQRKNHL